MGLGVTSNDCLLTACRTTIWSNFRLLASTRSRLSSVPTNGSHTVSSPFPPPPKAKMRSESCVNSEDFTRRPGTRPIQSTNDWIAS